MFDWLLIYDFYADFHVLNNKHWKNSILRYEDEGISEISLFCY